MTSLRKVFTFQPMTIQPQLLASDPALRAEARKQMEAIASAVHCDSCGVMFGEHTPRHLTRTMFGLIAVNCSDCDRMFHPEEYDDA